MNTLVIGDPHGKLDEYENIVRFADFYGYNTLSVGDNGFQKEWEWGLKHLNAEKHRWLHGNHDSMDYVDTPLSLGHFGVWNGIFTIRGAYSIDRSARIQGRDWFPDEELNHTQMNQCFDLWEKMKPQIVVTHDCPSSVCDQLFNFDNGHSVTRKFLEELFAVHQPKQWVFGHYHARRDKTINGTRFICLPELNWIKINH